MILLNYIHAANHRIEADGNSAALHFQPVTRSDIVINELRFFNGDEVEGIGYSENIY